MEGAFAIKLGDAPLGLPIQDKGEEGLCLSACSVQSQLCLGPWREKNAMVRQQRSISARAVPHQSSIMVVNTEVLNSWKEVATYLGRGVRTVQRWERELGLPIRRPRGKSRSPIIAFRPELDRWLRSAPTAERLGTEDLTKPDLVKGDLANPGGLVNEGGPVNQGGPVNNDGLPKDEKSDGSDLRQAG
jgi:hypothetical protein